MTIEQLLQREIGPDNRVGGFELTVRTARGYRVVNDRRVQAAVLENSTGKISADLLLRKTGTVIERSPVQKGDVLRIIVCWLQPGKDGSKELYVEQFSCKTMTPDEYEAMRDKENHSTWEDENVPSMCRNSQVREFICGYTSKHGELPECTKERMKIIDQWVDYILSERQKFGI